MTREARNAQTADSILFAGPGPNDRIAGRPPSEAEMRDLPAFVRALKSDYTAFVHTYSALPRTQWWRLSIGPAFAGLLQAALSARTGLNLEPRPHRNGVVPTPAVEVTLSMVNALAHADWWAREGDLHDDLAPLLWRYTLEDLALVLEDLRGCSGEGFVAHLIRDLPGLKCGGA